MTSYIKLYKNYMRFFSREVHDLQPMDVTPLSLGVDTARGEIFVLVKRHTMSPTRQTATFTTTHDNQTILLIQVLEGERTIPLDNNLIGKFRLEGIQAAPRGTPIVTQTT